MNVASRKKLDDVLIRTKLSSLRRTTDNRGIFYVIYANALDNITSNNDVPKFTENEVIPITIEVIRTGIQEVYFHRLGTSRSSDILFSGAIGDLDEHFVL
jgi:hypothetical protein